MKHDDGQAEQYREELRAEDKFRTGLLTEKYMSIIKNNEILICLRYGDKLYWKRAKLKKTPKDLRATWDLLFNGLIYKLKSVGWFSK